MLWATSDLFLPRIVGVLMLLAGSAYLVFLWPVLGDRLFFPYIAVLGVLGEGSLTLWLLIVGVNNAKWHQLGMREPLPSHDGRLLAALQSL